MTARRLAAATWPEIESTVAFPEGTAKPQTLLVPLGATEQHGPHLPLGVDTEIAVALAEAASARLPDAIVAPALPYGASGEHQGFPGTLSIGAEATELLLVELGRSASETFPRLLFVCAHGGNVEPLTAAVVRLRAEGRDARAFSPRWDGDAHAGRTETSLMLALDAASTNREPPVVREHRIAPGTEAPLASILGRLREEGVRAVSANGVLGDPTAASAEEGRELLAAAVEELVTAIADRRDGSALPEPLRQRGFHDSEMSEF